MSCHILSTKCAADGSHWHFGDDGYSLLVSLWTGTFKNTKPKIWTNWCFGQMMALDEKRKPKMIPIHPEGDMIMCTVIHPMFFFRYFTLNPQILISLWCHRKSQGNTKVIRINSVGNMNVYAKFYGNPSDQCWYPLSHAASMAEKYLHTDQG